MSGSINVALRKAVMAGLTAHLGTHEDFNGTTAPEDRVEVTYGYSLNSKAAQRVYTGFSRGDTPPHAMKSGRVHSNEDAEFDLIVRAKVPGGNVEDSDTRAMAIGAEIAEWVADHKNADKLAAAGLEVPAGFNWMYVASWDLRGAPDDIASESLLLYRIAWTARLT